MQISPRSRRELWGPPVPRQLNQPELPHTLPRASSPRLLPSRARGSVAPPDAAETPQTEVAVGDGRTPAAVDVYIYFEYNKLKFHSVQVRSSRVPPFL